MNKCYYGAGVCQFCLRNPPSKASFTCCLLSMNALLNLIISQRCFLQLFHTILNMYICNAVNHFNKEMSQSLLSIKQKHFQEIKTDRYGGSEMESESDSIYGRENGNHRA